MTVLLDTHALLWALAEPAKLSKKAVKVLEDLSTRLLVSPVSLFEIATKTRIGKLSCPPALLSSWNLLLPQMGADLLDLRGAAAILAGSWQVVHRDPFDRLLAAQAVEEGIPLVSKDSAFSQFPDLQVIW